MLRQKHEAYPGTLDSTQDDLARHTGNAFSADPHYQYTSDRLIQTDI